MEIVRKNAHFEELTHALLREFVDKIVVHECSRDEAGIRRQEKSTTLLPKKLICPRRGTKTFPSEKNTL